MTAQPPIRPVFDFGGVVFRWRPAELVARVWPERARSSEELAQTVALLFQGYQGDWGRFDQGLLTEGELIEAVAARTGWSPASLRGLLDAVPEELVPQPEVVEWVVSFKAWGYRPTFLSNMPAPFVRRLRAEYPLDDWFSEGVFSSDVLRCKPDPALFDLAARQFKEPVARLLLVDDHPANVRGASACGWQAVLFEGAASLRAALQAYLPR